ncbi:type II toxin-antitoxin system VapC family toxin [Comamonas sp.]|mgnify:CR=1 FL=1|uniref:type II toxin-antitoxin system VapC family toxin n=2 Tax=Pseudomonadota TaxID=1224 RepID=UPI00095FCBE5|nr:type II toxin-antitoxin system VapC family toxin [Comamonas sp.]MBN9330964.1 type II toxin-antitoxin system VapC family toxin [Comamonas sp.]OJX40363.1 MAG: VapC toxin family PIN domain ribonuclease [Enterobacter sp. 56-7]
MTRYMLDTNICIYLIRKYPPEIVEKFNQFRKGEIVISSITWAELCCGIKKDSSEVVNVLLSILDVLPFYIEQGSMYGMLTEFLPNRKANLDRMIAAHAITIGATLVTNNENDFRIYSPHGLKIENWVYQ